MSKSRIAPEIVVPKCNSVLTSSKLLTAPLHIKWIPNYKKLRKVIQANIS